MAAQTSMVKNGNSASLLLKLVLIINYLHIIVFTLSFTLSGLTSRLLMHCVGSCTCNEEDLILVCAQELLVCSWNNARHLAQGRTVWHACCSNEIDRQSWMCAPKPLRADVKVVQVVHL